MLTRLKVNGFKNLVDVDVRFGPFTCIAGVNGSGKSNLFDAIRFLAALAEKPLVEAALSVRGEGGRSSDIRSLFHRVGDDYAPEMSFEAEMIVPAEGIDDLGQKAVASNTFLKYSLKLSLGSALVRYESVNGGASFDSREAALQITHEELIAYRSGKAREEFGLPRTIRWQRSAIRGRHDQRLIWTEVGKPDRAVIRLQYDDRPMPLLVHAGSLPRTVLSRVESDQNATAVMVQQEMRSWRVFQFEPAELRKPDDLADLRSPIGPDGSHVATSLYRLAHTPSKNGRDPEDVKAAAYARIGNRLARLLDDVRDVKVDRDDGRELLTLKVAGRDHTFHSARSLSDGTLRFLALAVILEQEEPGLFCIEEPENGIHPGRIPALIELLQDIATDTNYPIEDGNPLRQVIITTHSPSVVNQIPDDSLVVSELAETLKDGRRFKRASFSGLSNTWRAVESKYGNVSLGTLLTYLNPERRDPPEDEWGERRDPTPRRVMDRDDVHRLLSPLPDPDD